MCSLLQVRIRKDIGFKWRFFGRHSHVDYVRDIAYSIMDRYSRRYVLYNDKAREIVFRVARSMSGDPKRTATAITQYFGFGKYIGNGDWEIDLYGFNPLKNAEHYTDLFRRIEINVNIGRLDYDTALFESPFEHQEIYLKYPKGWKNKCGACGVIGDFKEINFKSNLYGWHKDNWMKGEHNEKIKKANLCMGCWNKLKPIRKKELEAREIKQLSNKLNRERLKWLKSQTQVN